MKLSRVILISGKGGSGKSTVAASLARALTPFHRVLLLDLDGARAAAELAGVTEDHAPDRPLCADSITRRTELERFIERIVPLRVVARRMLASSTFGFVTAALPGLEAFLIVERLRLLAEELDPDRLIVVDGPATGGAVELLTAAAKIERLAGRGALRTLALRQQEFLAAPSHFNLWLTAIPEKLALTETLSALQLGPIQCATVVLNRARRHGFTRAELDQLSGLPQHHAFASALEAAHQATAHAAKTIHRAGAQVLELPALFAAEFGPSEIDSLARALAPHLPG